MMLGTNLTGVDPVPRAPWGPSRAFGLIGIALALVTLGVALYLWRPAILFALLPYAFFALCPLSMWLMPEEFLAHYATTPTPQKTLAA